MSHVALWPEDVARLAYAGKPGREQVEKWENEPL